ncbi:MAG: hypothetical protein HAW58_03260 [Candidatus Thioglobus sp.]|nr:hypothetical protein [Candidatus Thioglobus sp.]
MKNFNRLFALSIISILTLTLTNCGSSTNAGGGGDDSSQGVEITSANTVIVGVTLNLIATRTAAAAATIPATATFTWAIQDSSTNIATINGSTLTGIAPGTIILEAITLDSSGGTRTGTQKFSVVARPAAPTALKAVATGVANQVRISWAAVAGATGYKLYQTTGNLSGFENDNPDNLSTANPAATSTDVSGITTNINLGANSAKTYFLVTAVKDNIESLTTAAQTAATAHPLVFNTVISASTATVWIDRNLGATEIATTIFGQTAAYGDLYQWGRPTDGHQLQTNTTLTGTLSATISPGHAEFITTDINTNDWTAAGVDTDGADRAAFWSRTDGSGICPTGFRVPRVDELNAERASWPSQQRQGALASPLKWIGSGARSPSLGTVGSFATGNYWSSTVNQNDTSERHFLSFNAFVNAAISQSDSVSGYSIRCIQN